jgi:hypothetical protein
VPHSDGAGGRGRSRVDDHGSKAGKNWMMELKDQECNSQE